MGSDHRSVSPEQTDQVLPTTPVERSHSPLFEPQDAVRTTDGQAELWPSAMERNRSLTIELPDLARMTEARVGFPTPPPSSKRSQSLASEVQTFSRMREEGEDLPSPTTAVKRGHSSLTEPWDVSRIGAQPGKST